MQRAHIYVSGIVQGVNFRFCTTEQAEALGLKGWVRNLPDGRVEIVVEGEPQALEKLISWCHQGPPSAKVDNVKVEWEKYLGEFKNFCITD